MLLSVSDIYVYYINITTLLLFVFVNQMFFKVNVGLGWWELSQEDSLQGECSWFHATRTYCFSGRVCAALILSLQSSVSWTSSQDRPKLFAPFVPYGTLCLCYTLLTPINHKPKQFWSSV